MLDKYSNRTVASLLKSIAAVYIIKNESYFRIIAYEKAAEAIENLNREVKNIWEEGKLDSIPGIGKAIFGYLDEYFRTGKSRHFESVLKRVPAAVFELIKIRSIGPKRAYKLAESLKLNNPETAIVNLKKASANNQVARIPTFGEKTQQDFLNAINIYENRSVKQARMSLPYAFETAQTIINYLEKHPHVKRADALGSLRRMVTTIGDIDIAVMADSENNSDNIIDYFIKYPRAISIDNAGNKKASIIINPNIRVDLRVQKKDDYGSMLQYFTGSKTHNIKLREHALKKGYSLSEYGIKRAQNNKTRKFSNEKGIYDFLGLQYIPPEIREGTNEIELAEKNKLPVLVEQKDIKGDLHVHTSFDLKPSHDLGKNSALEIANYADKLGYEYVGFSDHNPSVSTNSENDINTIMKRRKEHFDKLFSVNKIERIKYFIGIEADILPDGKIALPKESYNYVDYIIASIHSSFNQDKKTMTERIVKALKNPKVRILGHPTGRLLDSREGYDLNWKIIFEHCQKKQIALEINSWPERLDLPDLLVREAINSGVKLVINTDAHRSEEMNNMFYGLSVAKRGWCQKSDIINTLSYKDMHKWLGGE